MAERRPPHTPPSGPDGDGVRVVHKPRGTRRVRPWALAVLVAVGVAAVAWFAAMPERRPGAGPAMTDQGTVTHGASATADDVARGPAGSASAASTQEPPPMSGADPDDLAGYFQPGDPEPTGAQVIEALQDAGVRTGLGAFNPPGTSPPLEGLAVPDEFVLPPGYVRHHQVTDEGVPIEPILMFSPDFTLLDAQGRPVALPANRVVPPELAPPGLPLRRVRVGTP